MVTLAVDAMGGDDAPREIVKGTVDAAGQLADTQYLLVGREAAIDAELSQLGPVRDRIAIVDAPDVIAMDEVPVEALKRKRGSSIARAVGLVRQGKAQAIVSAGNTGAAVAASYMTLGTLKGIRRPGIAAAFYVKEHPVVVMDVGANIHCKPADLFLYGIMASLYAQEVLGVRTPRIGILNIGEEEKKGIALVRETADLFQRAEPGLDFVGNVEGDAIFRGLCDVIICDGFVGNIVLKVSEGLAENVLHVFMEEFAKCSGGGAALDTFRETLDRFRWRIDYAEQGGAPLLGVNGVCIICHGRSHARAMTNAMRCAVRMVQKNLNHKIEALAARVTPLLAEVD
ncbi:MAG TPA: phosphate acyltransferase PlsX [Planctomycetes bacterium]|nr:phosphate acyltransferase PlsX [Planctomycetota bacterium]